MRYLTEGLVAGGLVAGVVWYATRDRDRAARERATAERVARLADARAQLTTAIARADGAITAGNVAGDAARVARLTAARGQFADAIARADGAITAGNVAGDAARAARLTEARAQLAAALARADDAIAAGKAAGDAHRVAQLADARAQMIAAIARADDAIVAGNAAAGGASPALAPRDKNGGLTRCFDDLFKRHGRGIPIAYLRALANAESGMDPHDRLGLINIVPKALAGYNERHPNARITADDMRDPAKNITVAADHLRVVVDGFRRHHFDVPNLVENWSNLHFVRLLTASWNAGHSESAGVGRVVRYLKAQPATSRPAEITIDTVFEAAARARATKHLSNPRKLAYAKDVVAAFVRERERDAHERVA